MKGSLSRRKNQYAQRDYKVLSIDGGGIRGIIPAMVLGEIEDRTGKPASELFDLIAGTSTGELLALGLAKPAVGRNKPQHKSLFGT